jgi:hypothetical protein
MKFKNEKTFEKYVRKNGTPDIVTVNKMEYSFYKEGDRIIWLFTNWGISFPSYRYFMNWHRINFGIFQLWIKEYK